MMLSSTKLLASCSFLVSIASSAPAPAVKAANTARQANNITTKPKVILDNDWYSAGFVPYLQALNAGWEVLGLVSDTSDSWAFQTGLHALATLERGGLSCIPVYKGSDYPILNTPKLLQAWEDVHGVLPYEGAFAPENFTAEATGLDPTGGDPDRISRAAFVEGYPNITFVPDMSAAEFMVKTVRRYPGEVSIYSAGALTNIALAVRLDPTFAANAKELVIMGGYIDVNLLMVTGSVLLAGLQSDINLIIDPEAAKIALTAEFPNITVVGNAANQVLATQGFVDEVHEVSNPYSDLLHEYYAAQPPVPFWDETAAAVMLDPSSVLNATSFYVDVDTSYSSPSYGNIHGYQKALAPRAQTLRTVNYVLEVDEAKVRQSIKQSVQHPPTCADL